jgi:nucleotide-binding universal stress UspA family protein
MKKTIIVGVDFTKSSYNAAGYAALLALKLNCKLVLFNMYEIPILHSNSGLYFMSNAPLREESENEINLFSKKLQTLNPKIEIHTFISTGFFKKELLSFIKTHKVQLVVMGLSAKSRFAKFLFGSHSTDIAGKINAPVIIVPDNYKTHALRKVLLGVDNKEKLHKSPLVVLRNFLKEAKLSITLLHVKTEDEIFNSSFKETLKIGDKVHKVESWFYPTIEKGITAYTQENKVDLITIISRKHSAFYNLFNESNTKQIAFASKIPVMCIHE